MEMHARFVRRRLWGMTLVFMLLNHAVPRAVAQETETGQTSNDLATRRMSLMRSRALAIEFRGGDKDLPQRVHSDPLFRYDDIPRGYLDGAVWQWGNRGRPQAIITTELHPKYAGVGPRIVYDFLSLSPHPFSAISSDSSWRPTAPAVQFKPLPFAGPEHAPDAEGSSASNGPRQVTPAQRRLQMRRIVNRFVASQVVSAETAETKHLKLRLLPRPIHTYRPAGDKSEAAIYLFVAGRMPGVILFLEHDGKQWSFGIGRLSAPSTLSVAYRGQEVYRVPPDFGSWDGGYNASNSPVIIPGVELPETGL